MESTMQPIFILIRGNSGSGKTVLAKQLQQYFGYEDCLLLQQDILRREILHTHDHVGTTTVNLLETLINFGVHHYKIIILEGILKKDVYGKMLNKIVQNFHNKAFVYYLDIPFSVTVRQNQLKENPFSILTLKKWWLPDDYLKNSKERHLTNGNTQDFFNQIIKDITNSQFNNL
jgi:adenylate kinase family enzyme